MSWPKLMEPALQGYIEERQSIALQTYETDPDLLLEHVRQEDSFRSGGYGTRQISELLQNAVDALGHDGGSGMVELRLADGALYCANEGAGFTEDGVRAVTHAFLSTKRGEEIGRFGLGFKSVLGISAHPQIFSRAASFEFNASGTAELFAGMPTERGRLPLLRVPQLADPVRAAAEDRNIAEMMGWATTIVKLPLTREGQRLRKELDEFAIESLLFLKPLDRLRITLQASAGAAPLSRDFGRQGHPGDGEVLLTAPGKDAERWLYAERQYVPSIDVSSTLPDTSRRKSMTVSYAVRPLGRTAGRLWSWFPLSDQTTASGVFNAPWQVNDDRTSLIPGSVLNNAMLGVAADLFLDVVTRASSGDDPAVHLDLFPARGDEARGNADKFLSEEIPRRAARRPMIPDTSGVLKVPTYFERVPDLEKTPITVSAARRWQERVERTTMPHWRCFTTPQRRLRLRTLMGGSTETRSARETNISSWLEELATTGRTEDVATALAIAVDLAASHIGTRAALQGSPIIPLDDGGWARVDACHSVLLPVEGADVPEGVRTVRSDVAADPGAADSLRALGYRAVSADQTAAALAHLATAAWHETEWTRFWKVLSSATPPAASQAITEVRSRDVEVLLPTRSGRWRCAREVFADDSFAPHAVERHVDPKIVPNVALRRAAGAVSGAVARYPLWKESLHAEYASAVEEVIRRYLRKHGITPPDRIIIPDRYGAGPLDVFDESLTIVERASWTRQILDLADSRDYVVDIPIGGGRKAEIRVSTMEWWAVRSRGIVISSLGERPVDRVVSNSLARFSDFLPVVDQELSGTLPLPRTLPDVPVSLVKEFLARDGYQPTSARDLAAFMVECAAREDLEIPDRIPALLSGQVALVPRDEVAVTRSESDAIALQEAGVAFVPTNGDHGGLIERWGLLEPDQALQQSLEITGIDGAVPILDIYPSLQDAVILPLGRQRVARAQSLFRVLTSRNGEMRKPLQAAKQDGVVVVDSSLDSEGTLAQLSRALDLDLTPSDIRGVLAADDAMRRSELIARAQVARNNEARLLLLVGADVLRQRLPGGLLPAVESRTGELGDREIAELFLQVHGQDAVRVLREDLRQVQVPVPDRWDGSPAAQSAVKRLGFDTSFGGTRERRPASVTQVQGQITLNPLHDFQRVVAEKIENLATTSVPEGQRGLLYLPTGAGKTRVTVEALLRMLKDGRVQSPILWIAQSQELCEQAIHSFAEVWRWLGDQRALDISRFWSGYELDESNEDLQVVVAIDDTLASRMHEAQYSWITRPGIVVIDEAHTAMSKNYTEILRQLGLTASRTERPLLGLTATPFRGRNDEINRLFALRFGENRLESLDREDPIGELRSRRVLSEVDYDILAGSSVTVAQQDDEFRKMKEVTRSMLTTIGQDMVRTQTVVDDIRDRLRDNPDWPVLVFAASVASAHTIAALLRLEGVKADSVDGGMRRQERRRVVERYKTGESQVLVNCDLLTQGFDAPQVRALYIARPTFSPNRYLQMVGRGLRGPANGGTERCLIVNVADTFEQFGEQLAYNEFDYLWSKK